MKKKAIATLLCAAMAVSALAGCGSGTAAPAAAESTASNEAQAEPAEAKEASNAEAPAEEQELNIAIFQGGYGDEYWKQMVAAFEESHEGVTVNMTISPTIADIIRPQIVAGNAPDFISLSDSSEDGLILSLIKENALLDITDVFDGQNYAGTGTLRDDITDGFLESTKCAPYQDGKIYLAPFNSGPQGLIYNKTFFDANKLEVPATWDEFFALGDTVEGIDGRALFTYQGIYPGYLEEMLWPAIASHCGEDAVKAICNYEEGSFNNAKVLEVLTKMQDISTNGYLLEGTVGMNHTESQSEMMIGHAAFITNGTWMESEMQDAPREDGFEFAMAPIPTFASGDTHYVMDSCEQFSIPAAAKNPELAKEFLRFLYSDESVKAFAETSGSLYATKTAKDVAKDYLSEATYNMFGIYDEPNAASLVVSFATVPSDCKVNPKDEIFNPITSVMNGDMSVEEWAEAVETAFAEVRAASK